MQLRYRGHALPHIHYLLWQYKTESVTKEPSIHATAVTQARRDPSCATTMIPNPVDLRVRHFPLKRDPSKYQVAESMASVCGGGVSQTKQPSSCDGGAGTRKTRSPLLRKMYRLIPEIRDSNSSAALGGSGQPPTGVVNLHPNRCSSVP